MFSVKIKDLKKSILKSGLIAFTALSLSVLCSVSSFASDECGKVVYKTSQVSESGYAPISFSSIYEENSSDGILKKAASLPSKYDSRDKNIVTSVKDQDIFGACWAFSSIAAAETSLINEYPEKFNTKNTDLSELHLSYFCFADAADKLNLTKGDWAKVKNDDYLNMGGNLYFASFTLARWFGVANEKVAPYESAYTNVSLKKNDAYTHNEAVLQNAYWVPMTNTDEIKKMIMKYGACGVSFYHDDLYLNNTTGGYYQRLHTIGNHSAALVGWDDNYSRDNFGGITGSSLLKPRRNGAWLIKNSYSDAFGDSGYFWVSYEDRSIYTDDAVFFDFTTTDTYDNNYQYDGTCAFSSYYYRDKIYASNIFTATQTEKLKAISFFQGDSSATYKYQIFKNVKNTSNPTSGTAVYDKYQSIDIQYAGYNTIELPFEIQLKKGEKFAVVILTQKNNGIAYAMCDYAGYIDTANTIYSHTYSEKGQSLMSKDGKTWDDLYNNKENENFRIKAFTKAGYAKPKSLKAKDNSVKLAVSKTEKIELTPTPSYASSAVKWSSSDKNVATVSSSGKVTAVGIGKATITYVSTADSNVKGKVTVTVIPKNVEKFVQTSSKTSSITVSWKKQTGVTGYMVYKYNKKTKEKQLIGKTKNNKFTLKNLNSGEKIKLYVSAYKDITTTDGDKKTTKTYISSKVSLTAMTRPKKVTVSAKKVTTGSVTLKWKKAGNAEEYRIYLYDSKKDEYTLLKKTSKTEVTINNLSKNKTYRFVVRARIYNGKNYYASADSNVLKVKTLKSAD